MAPRLQAASRPAYNRRPLDGEDADRGWLVEDVAPAGPERANVFPRHARSFVRVTPMLQRIRGTRDQGTGSELPVPGALLTAANVGARYGASVVLRGIDVHVQQGEIVTILGANGAGKTTFLGAVMGLVTM